MNKTTYTDFDQLPLSLKADDISAVLGISRNNAYDLMKAPGFPTIRIGKRMLAPRHKFLAWVDAQSATDIECEVMPNGK